ncbi:MAG TPA: sensor domain-containing diguanylate cyclase [Thermoanaerobaculia bacterium]|nr:sensor domain-containing diguanylate cyclase [Thermoanaerobaculia bacterium]
MVSTARVISPKLLSRYMERHRLLDETSGVPPERFLITLVNRALEFVPARVGVLLLDDPVSKEDDRSRNELVVIVTAGEVGEPVVGRKVRPVDGIAGFVYARGEKTAINFVGGAAALSRELDALFGFEVQNVLAVPVVIESNICGSIALLNRREEEAFSRKDERLMELFGDTLSLALQNLLDERRAREVARRDSLTSLYNDRYFHRKLQREIERLAGTKEGELSLLFLDCDHLKRVNDEHGHLAGSQVLREVSFIMQRVLAETVSLACRYGGDEFTVILLDQNLEQAAIVAEKLRRAVSEWVFLPMAIGPGEPALNLKNVLSMSVGVASYRAHCAPGVPSAEQKNQLLKAADAALYMAKTKGKNCVVAAPPGPGGGGTASVILKS